MSCPKCNRKRYKEKIIKRVKKNFLVRECLVCKTQYNLVVVRKSKLTNTWVEIESSSEKDTDKEDK